MCTNFWINPHNGKLPSRLAPAQCQNSLAPQLLSNIYWSKTKTSISLNRVYWYDTMCHIFSCSHLFLISPFQTVQSTQLLLFHCMESYHPIELELNPETFWRLENNAFGYFHFYSTRICQAVLRSSVQTAICFTGFRTWNKCAFLCALYNLVEIESPGKISDTIKLCLTFYQQYKISFYMSLYPPFDKNQHNGMCAQFKKLSWFRLAKNQSL